MATEKILVTGGTGYIGSHTVVELQKEGYEVIIVDNLANSDIDVLDGIEKISGKKPQFHELDLCFRDQTHTLLKEINPDAIIHFAAFKAVGESVKQPLKYYQNNLVSLFNLLEGLSHIDNQRFVFSSSCTVYGNPKTLPVDENTPTVKAESPYGNTKKMGEEILSDTCRAKNDLQVISLRYFNPIGAHKSAHIGELPKGVPSNLVPFITQTAAGIRPQLKVFGDNYNTPDGTCIRDYIHVVDTAKAHVAAVKRLLENKNKENYEIFNLGTGKGHTVMEVIKSFEKTSGERLNYTVVDRRPGDVEKIYADTKKANKILNWKTELTLDDMTKSAWKWQQKLKEKS